MLQFANQGLFKIPRPLYSTLILAALLEEIWGRPTDNTEGNVTKFPTMKSDIEKT